ncbi:alpha/beta fold hydrolase [Desertibacillus haloalkaliphilus]|uniref:alpha/beta fold hydrolase n=1 Tax=Desertibacillus haloalkaliphilus TaxID=1328930 RepID=UPI001C275455|nr:alpha/beta fold hydrolase [Desertibacillus haloalkaliphilus]MBU8907551.1 alpha/beta hydrolase [Desertibacillus haloalkaliphilus]
MPIAKSQSEDIYYEIYGEGEPLLLIMGLSLNSLSWYRSIPEFSKHYQVIAFDNRGTGQSSKPSSPYSIKQMAADARAVLDDAGVNAAHIYGISMGGMIAQRIAIDYPERVRSLILGCTTPGGSVHVQPAPEVSMQMMQRANMDGTPEEIAWAAAPILYSPEFLEQHRSEVAADINRKIETPTPAYAYMRQLEACLAHDTYEHLSNIKVPTLVIHGNEDTLVPYDNGKRLATEINQAELLTIEGAGHMYSSEAPEQVHQSVLSFLKSL